MTAKRTTVIFLLAQVQVFNYDISYQNQDSHALYMIHDKPKTPLSKPCTKVGPCGKVTVAEFQIHPLD